MGEARERWGGKVGDMWRAGVIGTVGDGWGAGVIGIYKGRWVGRVSNWEA